MDMNMNRNVKLRQVSSIVAEKASSDGTTNKQCRPAQRQSTETTVTDTYTNFADKPKPTLSQRPAVAAEEAGTDGMMNVQCRSNDDDYMKTTIMNLPTDFVKLTEPTLSRVSPVVAKEAHTDGTRVVQYQSDDQNSMKTTIMQMPMDYLEIPEPSLPRGLLELAEVARYVNVESGQSCHTEEVQSQEAGLTRPVFVTIMEYSPSVPKEGAMIAPGISTEMIPPIFSAGHHYPVDQLGLVGPWDKTDQSVLPGSDAKDEGTDLEIISKEETSAVPQTEFQTQSRNMTIRRKENSSVSSGTVGRNSDIGDLADFSADEEEPQVEQFSGCRIPRCQCEGRIEYMEWDSDDMTDAEDSEWEDPDERENRLWVERYNYDLIEGMTLMTYTPPPRKNRRRRYEDNVIYAPEVQESNCRTSEMGFRTEEESPQLEPALQPRTDADENIPSCRDMTVNPRSRPEVIILSQ